MAEGALPLTVELCGAEAADLLSALHATAFDDPWSRTDLADLILVGARAILARRGGLPVGFILVQATLEEAEVLTLAVLPAAQRRGVGARLLQEAARRLVERGVDRLLLEVAADNPAGLALYAKSGFVVAGRRRNYYQRPGGAAVDALVMRLALNRRTG